MEGKQNVVKKKPSVILASSGFVCFKYGGYMRSEGEGEVATAADLNDRQHCGRKYKRQEFKLRFKQLRQFLRTAAL